MSTLVQNGVVYGARPFALPAGRHPPICHCVVPFFPGHDYGGVSQHENDDQLCYYFVYNQHQGQVYSNTQGVQIGLSHIPHNTLSHHPHIIQLSHAIYHWCTQNHDHHAQGAAPLPHGFDSTPPFLSLITYSTIPRSPPTPKPVVAATTPVGPPATLHPVHAPVPAAPAPAAAPRRTPPVDQSSAEMHNLHDTSGEEDELDEDEPPRPSLRRSTRIPKQKLVATPSTQPPAPPRRGPGRPPKPKPSPRAPPRVPAPRAPRAKSGRVVLAAASAPTPLRSPAGRPRQGDGMYVLSDGSFYPYTQPEALDAAIRKARGTLHGKFVTGAEEMHAWLRDNRTKKS